jgi:hypothetical protein
MQSRIESVGNIMVGAALGKDCYAGGHDQLPYGYGRDVKDKMHTERRLMSVN